MITILVTGKNSQLAQCIDSIASQYPNFKFIFKTSKELDITNRIQVSSVFENSDKFDFCINCAAFTAVDNAENEKEKAYQVNVEGVKNIAEACRDNHVILVHVSSDFVFDGSSLTPYTEESVANPLSLYGETKLKGEHIIQQVLSSYFIIRTSWLYSEYGNNFFKTMLRLSEERKEIGVVDDQIGCPTYANDLAEVILNLLSSKNSSFGIYNFSNSGAASWFEFAREVFKISNSKIKLNPIETKDYPTPAKRPKYSVLDTSKIKETLDIDIPNWKDGLRRTYYNLIIKSCKELK